jgi:small-conductance mechanosensitive channel/CRP-like cAMP-binding protein
VTGALSSLPAQVIAGLVLLALAFAVRTLTLNRVVRSRVRLTMMLAVVFVGVNAALAAPTLVRPETRSVVTSVGQLVFALAVIHFLVLVLVNPLRVDRVPERFPTIVQDIIVFALFMLVATVVMDEKFLTTSAVGAVVAGLALQDTLGNLVSGLAIQVEKPFQLGHWIRMGEWEGEVVETTWRAARVRTRQGNQVIIPNSELSKSALVNYSEPAAPTRIHVDVGTSYDDPPNRVKAAIQEVLEHDPAVLKAPAPMVHLLEFAAFSLNYRVHFWIERYPMDEEIKDRVRTAIFYALKRHGVAIPFPTQIEYSAELPRPGPDLPAQERALSLLGGTDLFGLLADENRKALVAASPLRTFGDGESIVRQGEAGKSAYVICEGRVRVSLDPGDTELAVLEPGAYFGEMSLLTGDPRTATVRALGDCRVLEVTAEQFRRFVLDKPSMVDRIGMVVAERRAALAHARASAASVSQPESANTLIQRVRRFLRV